ncbi:ferrochelatase [Pacificimonas flava]|uniref:Ferrochelatase n=2 Tax=Pacificimonas TaxID=1960290 RepID=A0A219B2J0_9SPHN|nr:MULTISPECIES: ferrochelatase [Pacificimonas]MBZ6380060.1 ferrochelatase [Pacificimonas aurantium]OWV32029.1 ferrochelatase [Pacificimonas flava]
MTERQNESPRQSGAETIPESIPESRQLPADHPPVPAPKLGVLLVNLGSPDRAETASVRRYLAQFLSDPRVIEIPKLAWQPILRGVILRTRPAKSAKLYASIWDRERDGSPLKLITEDQASGLQARFPDCRIDYAMRYGSPAVADRLAALKDAGCERILLLPMYPQYSAATTATVVDEAHRWMAKTRWQPTMRTAAPWYDDPAYLDALEADLRTQLGALDFEPQLLLFTFHGMPKRTLELGDPYHCQCQKTARLMAERLDVATRIVFQSRFGPAEWLQPYLDEALEGLPAEGVQRVAVAAPGFTADCLETLEEIAIQGREQFEGAGGAKFAYLDCLNAKPAHLDLLETVISRELAGWRESG